MRAPGRFGRRALLVSVAGLALAACSRGEEEEPEITPGASNISDPRGLAQSGQSSRDSAGDVAQQVAERLLVRDGTSVDQMMKSLMDDGLLTDDATVKMDAAGLDDVVDKTFQKGQTFDLTEPSKVGRYGELPDSESVVERSVSLSMQGISTEDLEDVSRVEYSATVYVVLKLVDDKWMADGLQVLAFSED